MVIHALERLQKRYSKNLEIQDLSAIRHAILDGQAKFVESYNSTGRQTYLVSTGHGRVKAVWCPKLKIVITVLPLKGRKSEGHRKVVFRNGKTYAVD